LGIGVYNSGFAERCNTRARVFRTKEIRMGSRRRGSGRRKVGRKKRRMRAKIRHRK
jgi:hypothetical protein